MKYKLTPKDKTIKVDADKYIEDNIYAYHQGMRKAFSIYSMFLLITVAIIVCVLVILFSDSFNCGVQ